MISVQKTEEQWVRDRQNPEQVELLQEELELEKEKRELISSMFNDWIYEYNIREHTINTISGNGDMYCFKEVQREEKTFRILADLHPEDEKRLIESSREMHNPEPVHQELRIRHLT